MRSSLHRPQRTRRHAVSPVYGPDRIGLVGFNDNGFVIAKPAPAYAAWLQERTQKLHAMIAGTGTNLTDGLRQAVMMQQRTPPGILRRIYLLTDGYSNREIDTIWQIVHQARQSHVNVNTIGFGNDFDEPLLRRISTATHNGKFISVQSLRGLTKALAVSADHHPRSRRHHRRAETTILALDLSGSMLNPMGKRKKIEVVQEAVLHLLHYKQQCFS